MIQLIEAIAWPKRPRRRRWLLLIRQIPPRPNYLRVKFGRQWQRVGAEFTHETILFVAWAGAALAAEPRDAAMVTRYDFDKDVATRPPSGFTFARTKDLGKPGKRRHERPLCAHRHPGHVPTGGEGDGEV